MYTLMQYVKSMESLDGKKQQNGCMSLLRSTDDGDDRSGSSRLHDGELNVGDWWGTKLLSSIERQIDVVGSYYQISFYSLKVFGNGKYCT